MGSCDRKALWALSFLLLLLGSSSVQGTWEAMLPARLAEKSQVSARRGGGASGGRWPRGQESPDAAVSYHGGSLLYLSCSDGGQTGLCPPKDPFLIAMREERGPRPCGDVAFDVQGRHPSSQQAESNERV